VQVRTDDEVYRVDAVWLGPPKATFPWRARYVAWGVGILVFLLVLSGERAVGFAFGFFTVAWALVGTVVITRFITSKISHERPLGAVFTMWARELTSPRERTAGQGGAVSATKIHIRSTRPSPRRVNRSAGKANRSARSAQHVQYVPHAQGGDGQPTGRTRGRADRPRSKEVGGVRTQGRT
jgi:hypothetical protein